MTRIVAILAAVLSVAANAFGQEGAWQDGASVPGGKKREAASVPPQLVFAWPVPSTFRLLHRQKKAGHVTVVAHRMAVTRAASGALLVTTRSSRILELDGRDYSELEAARHLAGIFRLPAVRIGREGRSVRGVGFDAFMQRSVRAAETNLQKSAAGRRRLDLMRQTMRSPEAAIYVERAKTAYWREWVGHWAGLAIAARGRKSIADGGPLPNGRLFAAPATLRHHGPVRGIPGHVRLTYGRTMRGPAALKAVRGFVRIGPNGRPVFRPDVIRRGEDWTFAQTVDVVTRPDTLQPATVTSKQTATLRSRSGAEVTQTVEHEYTFDWSDRRDAGVR